MTIASLALKWEELERDVKCVTGTGFMCTVVAVDREAEIVVVRWSGGSEPKYFVYHRASVDAGWLERGAW
jgi:hypothetical protein